MYYTERIKEYCKYSTKKENTKTLQQNASAASSFRVHHALGGKRVMVKRCPARWGVCCVVESYEARIHPNISFQVFCNDGVQHQSCDAMAMHYRTCSANPQHIETHHDIVRWCVGSLSFQLLFQDIAARGIWGSINASVCSRDWGYPYVAWWSSARAWWRMLKIGWGFVRSFNCGRNCEKHAIARVIGSPSYALCFLFRTARHVLKICIDATGSMKAFLIISLYWCYFTILQLRRWDCFNTGSSPRACLSLQVFSNLSNRILRLMCKRQT